MNEINFESIKETVFPYFVEVYGEEYRSIIKERLDKIIPIFYDSIEMKKASMLRILASKRIELTLQFLENLGIEISEDRKKEMIRTRSTSYLNSLPQVVSLLQAYFGRDEYFERRWDGIEDIKENPKDEYEKNNCVKKLNLLGMNVTTESFDEWVLTEEAKQVFSQIERDRKYIKELDADFESLNAQFQDLDAEISASSYRRHDINEKYSFQFFCSIEPYMNDHDKRLLERYKAAEGKDFDSGIRDFNIRKIVGTRFYEESLLKSFTKEAEERLENPKTNSYIKESIINNKIEYYKYIGVYQDEMEPKSFLSSAISLERKPSPEMVEQILKQKELFSTLAENEYLYETSTYQENLKQLKDLDLITNPDFSIETIKNKVICVTPQMQNKNGSFELICPLFFSPESCLTEFMDTMLIHEINHAIELSLLHYNPNTNEFMYKCGFETIKEGEEDNRGYEKFSEVINQRIAIKVTEAMHRDGVYLLDNPDISKTRGGTSYEQMNLFVNDFLANFEKGIIQSRVDSTLDTLYQIVQKENFESLNQIINEYNALPYYEMMDALINHEKTELTEKRAALIHEADIINQFMLEHAKEVNPSLFESTGMQM